MTTLAAAPPPTTTARPLPAQARLRRRPGRALATAFGVVVRAVIGALLCFHYLTSWLAVGWTFRIQSAYGSGGKVRQCRKTGELLWIGNDVNPPNLSVHDMDGQHRKRAALDITDDAGLSVHLNHPHDYVLRHKVLEAAQDRSRHVVRAIHEVR